MELFPQFPAGLGIDDVKAFIDLVRLERKHIGSVSQILLEIRESGLSDTEKLALAYSAGILTGSRRALCHPRWAFIFHMGIIEDLTRAPDDQLEVFIKTEVMR